MFQARQLTIANIFAPCHGAHPFAVKLRPYPMSTSKFGQKVITFNGGVIDRVAPQRALPGYIEGLAASENARTICFANDRALIDVEASPPQAWRSVDGAIERKGPVKRMLLGLEPSGDPLFAQFVEHDEEGRPAADVPASVRPSICAAWRPRTC